MGNPALRIANPKGASRPNPASPRRASARRPASSRAVREKRHRYGWTASGGSVVGGDPVNFTDPLGLCPTPTDPTCEEVEVDEIVVTGRRPPPCDWWCQGGRLVGGAVDFVGRQLVGGRGSVSVNDETCVATAPGVGPGRYGSAVGSAGAMTGEFFTGLGPGERTFGPNSAESALMASSPGIQDIFSAYEVGGDNNSTFGLRGYLGSRANPTRQFVGSFRGNIRPIAGGYQLSLSNRSSVRSLTAGLASSHSRNQSRPMGDTFQTYVINYECG